MKRVIVSSLIKYNANTGDHNVGDCVKRAISVAFKMDYNDASKALNRTRKAHGLQSYNCTSNIAAFLAERGLKFTTLYNSDVTVEEFAEKHPTGSYVLLTGKEKQAARGISSHMLAIVNGDVYDSWNSLGHKVVRYCKVEDETEALEPISVDAIVPDIHEFVESYASHLQDKFPYGYILINEPDFEPIDGVGGIEGYAGTEYGGDTFKFRMRIEWIEGSFEPVKFYNSKYDVYKTFVVKMNPAHDLDTNLANNKKRLKQRIYDWLYDIKKLIDDSEKSKTVEFNPRFHGNKRKAMKLPEWSWPYLIEFEEGRKSETYGDYPFVVYLEPMPGDPRSREGSARIEGWTLSELKQNMEWYRTDFARYGYDY